MKRFNLEVRQCIGQYPEIVEVTSPDGEYVRYTDVALKLKMFGDLVDALEWVHHTVGTFPQVENQLALAHLLQRGDK